MKKAIAVAVALAAASGANAAWQSGTNNTAGELLLTVWNAAGEVAFSQDLGVLTADLLAGNVADGSTYQLSPTGLAHVGVGSGLSWNIAGADTAGLLYDDVSGRLNTGMVFTNTGNVPTTPVDYFGTVSGVYVNTFFPQIGNIMAGGTGADPVVLTSGDLAHAGEDPIWGNGLGGITQANPQLTGTAGADGATIEMLAFTAIVTDPTTFDYVNVIESMGFWTLDSAAGTLTYSASAVPVPAAAWLFGSALMGLAGVARRRK